MKAVLRAGLFVTPVLFAVSVWADDGGHHGNNNGNNANNGAAEFSAPVVGSSPGTMIGGVTAGGAPWVVASGSAELNSAGKLEVQVTGLLLGPGAPANLVGTVGPVQMVAASVVCGGSGGTVAASTGGVALNASGNASIESTVTLPSSCVGPIVLVRIFNAAAAPGSQVGAFIASTGIAANANAGGQNNNDDGDERHGH